MTNHMADDDDLRDEDVACKRCGEKGGSKNSIGYCTDCAEDEYQKSQGDRKRVNE